MEIQNVDCKDKKEATVKLEYTDVIDIMHALDMAFDDHKVQASVCREFAVLVDLLRIGKVNENTLSAYAENSELGGYAIGNARVSVKKD